MSHKPRFFQRTSLIEIKQRISRLKSAKLDLLSRNQLRQRIGRLIDDYPIQLRPLDLMGIYRARKNPLGREFTNASELWYPPAAAVTAPSRLNGVGQVRLYAASMPNTTTFELKPQVGDVFTILVALTRSEKVEHLKNVMFIGVERSLAPERSSLGDEDLFRTSKNFRQQMGLAAYKKWLAIDDYLSEIMGETIAETDAIKYKLTGALGDLLFEFPELDAVTYPSVATSNHGINICLLPKKADEYFQPSEAWEIQISELARHPDVDEPLYGFAFLRRSARIGADGEIVWLPPGFGINTDTISNFVRYRITNLSSRPEPTL